MRGTLGLRQATQGQVAAMERAGRAGGTGSMLISAAEGAGAIMGGGRASGAQAAAINAAQRALGLSNQNAQTVLRILGQLNDNDDKFAAALKQIEARGADARR